VRCRQGDRTHADRAAIGQGVHRRGQQVEAAYQDRRLDDRGLRTVKAAEGLVRSLVHDAATEARPDRIVVEAGDLELLVRERPLEDDAP